MGRWKGENDSRIAIIVGYILVVETMLFPVAIAAVSVFIVVGSKIPILLFGWVIELIQHRVVRLDVRTPWLRI